MLILNNIFFLWVIISSEIAIFVQVNCKIESFYDPKKEFLCYYDGDGREFGEREGVLTLHYNIIYYRVE